MCDSTVPSESTASMPRSWARIGPYRSTRSPPALVATAPPTVALCRAGDEHAQVQAGIGVGDLLQAHPGPGADLPGVKVDRAEPVQPGQAEHHLAVQRDAAADQAGVPALRDDRHPGVRAQREAAPRPRAVSRRAQHGRACCRGNRPVQSTRVA